MGICPYLYVDARKPPEYLRGYTLTSIAIIRHWEKVPPADLDYLVKQVLRPFCKEIIFSTPLIEALL